MKMKLIRQYGLLQEAYIAKGMLDANGIHSAVSENALNSIYPTPDTGTSSINLYVDSGDFDKADKLLTEHGD